MQKMEWKEHNIAADDYLEILAGASGRPKWIKKRAINRLQILYPDQVILDAEIDIKHPDYKNCSLRYLSRPKTDFELQKDDEAKNTGYNPSCHFNPYSNHIEKKARDGDPRPGI